MSLCVIVMCCIQLMFDSRDYEFDVNVSQLDFVKMQPGNNEKLGIRKLCQKENGV